MLDYMDTHYPQPTIHESCKDIIHLIKNQHKNEDIKYKNEDINNIIYKKYLIHENELMDTIKSWMVNDNFSYSYPGWILNGKQYYKKKTLEFLSIYKKNKIRRKIRVYIKTLGILYLLYKESIDKLYNPNGIFVKNMSIKWNPLLLQKYSNNHNSPLNI